MDIHKCQKTKHVPKPPDETTTLANATPMLINAQKSQI